MIKDADEIALLTAAAHAADRVVERIAAGRLVGRTEADVAREVRDALIEEGHDTAQFAIAPRAELRVAAPQRRTAPSAPEPIVLDIGGTLGGYGSDITRTLWVDGGDATAGPDERFRDLLEVLYEAQASGRGPSDRCRVRGGRHGRALGDRRGRPR